MLNHVRTLLLNLSGPSPDPTAPGEEFIPPTYRAKRLPAELQTVRNLLLGSSPDRLFLNYRLRQLLTVLHTTELEEYVYDFDPRVTYWPWAWSDEQLWLPTFGSIATSRRAGSGTIYVQGQLTADDQRGRLQQSWTLTALSASSLQIATYGPDAATTGTTLTFANGLSAPVSLGRTGLTVKIAEDPNPAGSIWEITATAKPQPDLGQLVLTLQSMLGADAMTAIFGASPGEPVLTFRNLWQQHPQLAYRLGGLLLGLITKIDQI